jgi:hypothetical protein
MECHCFSSEVDFEEVGIRKWEPGEVGTWGSGNLEERTWKKELGRKNLEERTWKWWELESGNLEDKLGRKKLTWMSFLIGFGIAAIALSSVVM